MTSGPRNITSSGIHRLGTAIRGALRECGKTDRRTAGERRCAGRMADSPPALPVREGMLSTAPCVQCLACEGHGRIRGSGSGLSSAAGGGWRSGFRAVPPYAIGAPTQRGRSIDTVGVGSHHGRLRCSFAGRPVSGRLCRSVRILQDFRSFHGLRRRKRY